MAIPAFLLGLVWRRDNCAVSLLDDWAGRVETDRALLFILTIRGHCARALCPPIFAKLAFMRLEQRLRDWSFETLPETIRPYFAERAIGFELAYTLSLRSLLICEECAAICRTCHFRTNRGLFVW